MILNANYVTKVKLNKNYVIQTRFILKKVTGDLRVEIK
jgi:hypothetical protein